LNGGQVKISIITVVFNNERTIEDTILSIEAQTHSDIEHIVVDGASTDGTMDVLQRHRGKIAQLVSEPDEGIFDAMNKGIRLATGEVIAFLNADDIYADNTVLAQVAAVFSDTAVDACYADLVYVDPVDLNKVVRFWKSQDFKPGLFQKGWVPAHPTFFARKKVYQQYGDYDVGLRLASDFELMLRFLEKFKVKSVYVPRVFVKMRTGGVSNNSILNIIQQNMDIYRACKKNSVPVSPLFAFTKIISKLSQFYSKPVE
jgi:glycosyltransferase involved in cell wall biosynthesis